MKPFNGALLSIAVAGMLFVSGCASTKWAVIDESQSQDLGEQAIALNAKHHAKLQSLADSLNAAQVRQASSGGQPYNFVSFEIYKGSPVVAVYSAISTSYNIQRTSKVSRAASAFSDGLPPVLWSMNESGLLEESGDFDTVKIYLSYSTQDFSVRDPFARLLTTKDERSEFFIPKKVAKQYLNQDLSAQDLLSKSVVLINGERNTIKTDSVDISD